MKRPSTTVGRAVAACVTAAALLGGCGVQQTDVIEAGGPATVGVYPGNKQRMLLFFLSSEGRLLPVSRWAESSELSPMDTKPMPVPKVLGALFAGPSDSERKAGLHTELPQLKGPTETKTDLSELVIVFPFAVRPLEATALQQVVCTTAFATGDGSTEVIIAGKDGALPSAHCTF